MSAASTTSASEPNINNKRPLQVIPASSKSPTAPKPLRKDTKLIGKYFEYDLSKMTNSKGGFLVDDNGDKEVDEEMRRREKMRELQRIEKNAEPRKLRPEKIFDIPRLNPPTLNSHLSGSRPESSLRGMQVNRHRSHFQERLSLPCLQQV